MERETLLKQLGSISETYVLEAADIASSERPERQERRGSFWFRLRTSPLPAVCLGFVVALVVIVAIVRASWTSPETPVGTEDGMPGASLSETDVIYTPPVDAPEEDAALIAQGYTARIGRVVRFTGGYFFVWQDNSGRWDFTVLKNGFGQTDAIPDDLGNGDLVRVYCQYIEESFPSQMPVCRAELLERGELGLVNRDVLGNIMALSGDDEMGAGWAIRFDNIQTGRLYRMEKEWFLICEDKDGKQTGYCYLRSGSGLDRGLSEDLRTGDRVEVSGGFFYYTDPPILPTYRVTLLERGDEGDIDPAILRELTDWGDLKLNGGTLPPFVSATEPEAEPETEPETEPLPEGYTVTVGRTLRRTNGSYYFISENGGDLVDLASAISGFNPIPDDLHNGDLVRVYHMGIPESYPALLPVYRLELIREGALTEITNIKSVLNGIIGETHHGSGTGFEFDVNVTGRLYHDEANGLWYLFWTDDEGHTTRRIDLLYDYLIADADFANFRTGDLVTVSGGSYLGSDPPILPVFYVTLLERGDKTDIDPEHLAGLANYPTE